jgi:peptide/nickel transport system substrate-binding protein
VIPVPAAPSRRIPRLCTARLPAAVLGFAVALLLPSCGRGRSDTLSVIWSGNVLSLDPNTEFEFASDTIAMNVFEPLLRLDQRLSFAPVLAESWDIADGRTWRFRLRKGVSFHDGTPLTAEDVVFTIERVRSSARSDLKPFLAGITSVRALDPSTVEVVSERPADLLPALSFIYILPKASLEKAGEKKFFEKPAGTGPYEFVEQKPHERLVLRRFDAHRGPAPYFARAVFRHVKRSDDKWIAARDNAPAIILGPGRKAWNEHQKDRDFVLLSRHGISVQFLACNMRPGSPLADVRVRRALRAAIDYEALSERVSGGQSFAASQLVTPDIFGFDPQLAVPAFEPGLAKTLLTKAGHASGLDLTLNTGEGPDLLSDELIRQLGLAGVRVRRVPAPEGSFFRRLQDCEGDLHLSGWFCSTGDASELLVGTFTSGRVRTRPTACGYGSAELDALVETAARTLDARERRALLQGAMRRLVEDLPWIPLLVSYDRYALTKGLAWEPRADGELFLPDVRRSR